jgi:NAD(P)H dehydrogenase (quinone)
MSQATTVLVTAATGFTGGATVEEFLARGRHVRALAHREDARSKRLQELGAEVVFGDFLDLDAIRAAVQGVQRAYFCYPIRPGIIQATAYFAQAAKEAGIDGVVNMSQVCARADAKSHTMGDHWLAERVFDWSGLTVAHLRPTLFAEWLLYLAPMIRAGLLHVPFGPGRHAPIAAEDQARVIVGILEDPASHRGKIYPLYGPVEFTHKEIAQVLSRVLGKDVQYKQVSFETWLQIMASGGRQPPAEHSARALYGEFGSSHAERWTFEQKPEGRTGDSFLIQHLREVAIDHQNGVFAGTNDLVSKIGGRQPTTLEEFITKHRQAFA